jgi:hypothetical protein
MVLWTPPNSPNPNPIGDGPWDVVTLADDGQELRTNRRMADLANVLAAAFKR